MTHTIFAAVFTRRMSAREQVQLSRALRFAPVRNDTSLKAAMFCGLE